MGYRENVQALCDRLGLSNPIREEDLKIESISFLIGGEWQRIQGSDMNRAGRLFFQYYFSGKSGYKYTNRHLLHRASIHFAENWIDAEVAGRKMLIALKNSTRIRIREKI
jgi:hypothetical protein